MRGWTSTWAVCAALCLPAAAESSAQCTGLSPGPARTVARVIDGETLALDDGSELRLVGALAPRAADVGMEAGGWALEGRAREHLSFLVLGKSIEVGFGGERVDRYGRLQAHAFLIDGDQRLWLQGLLLGQGLARAYALGGNRACGEALLSAERAARDGQQGLWAEAAYKVRRADRAADLLRYRATFQLVEGQVARVAQARGTIYINFDGRWRQGFSVSLRREDLHLLGKHADHPKGLEGRTVRVRGWLDQRGAGPTIDLSSGGLLEIIDPGAR